LRIAGTARVVSAVWAASIMSASAMNFLKVHRHERDLGHSQAHLALNDALMRSHRGAPKATAQDKPATGGEASRGIRYAANGNIGTIVKNRRCC